MLCRWRYISMRPIIAPHSTATNTSARSGSASAGRIFPRPKPEGEGEGQQDRKKEVRAKPNGVIRREKVQSRLKTRSRKIVGGEPGQRRNHPRYGNEKGQASCEGETQQDPKEPSVFKLDQTDRNNAGKQHECAGKRNGQPTRVPRRLRRDHVNQEARNHRREPDECCNNTGSDPRRSDPFPPQVVVNECGHGKNRRQEDLETEARAAEVGQGISGRQRAAQMKHGSGQSK